MARSPPGPRTQQQHKGQRRSISQGKAERHGTPSQVQRQERRQVRDQQEKRANHDSFAIRHEVMKVSAACECQHGHQACDQRSGNPAQ